MLESLRRRRSSEFQWRGGAVSVCPIRPDATGFEVDDRVQDSLGMSQTVGDCDLGVAQGGGHERGCSDMSGVG